MLRDQLEEQITKIESGGSTDLSSGWRMGLLEVQNHSIDEYINKVIILSDGMANLGETKKYVLEQESKRAYNLGIITSTIGIGTDFDEDLLCAIAEASSGNFWFVEKTSFEDIVEKEFDGAFSIICEHPRIRLDLPIGVEINASMNALKMFESSKLEFNLHPLLGGKRVCYAWRLEIEPKKIQSSQNKSLIFRAVLLDKGVEISDTSTEVIFGTQEEVLAVPVNGAVVEEVQNYLLSQSEEILIKYMKSGDMNNAKSLIKKMHSSMSDVRENAILTLEEQQRMEEEIRQIEVIQEIILMIDKVVNISGINKDMLTQFTKDKLPKIFSKLMRYRIHKHRERKWDTGHDSSIHNYVLQEILQPLFLILLKTNEEVPNNQKVLKLLGELGGQMGSYSN